MAERSTLQIIAADDRTLARSLDRGLRKHDVSALAMACDVHFQHHKWALLEDDGMMALIFLGGILEVRPWLIPHRYIVFTLNRILTVPGVRTECRAVWFDIISKSHRNGLYPEQKKATKPAGRKIELFPNVKHYGPRNESEAGRNQFYESVLFLHRIEELNMLLGRYRWRAIGIEIRQMADRKAHTLKEVAHHLKERFDRFKAAYKLHGRVLSVEECSSIVENGLDSKSPCYEITCQLFSTLSFPCFKRTSKPITSKRIQGTVDKLKKFYGSEFVDAIKAHVYQRHSSVTDT